jgi:gliding motility-associated protein GldL
MSNHGKQSLFETLKWKKFMAKLYGLGAAVVIVGALFKIQHWPFAGPMLIVGLGVEAVIFAFSAFEPLHEELDWTLVYPELAGIREEEKEEDDKLEEGQQMSVTEQLDKMLEEAKIGPDLIASLGEGMRSLSDQTAKISNITDATIATNEYVDSVKSASKNVSSLSESYSKAAESLTNLALSKDDSMDFGQQLGKVSKNLSALNAVYELQLQGASDHQRSSDTFYSSLGTLVKNLNDSVEDTKRYKTEMSSLSDNLAQLNNVYGNMLSAMNVKR